MKAMDVVDFIEDLESMNDRRNHEIIERQIDHNMAQPSYKIKLDDFLKILSLSPLENFHLFSQSSFIPPLC